MRSRAAVCASLLCGTISLVVSCVGSDRASPIDTDTGVEAGGPADAGVQPDTSTEDAGPGSLSIEPELPRVERGKTAEVKIKLGRTATLRGDVAVDLAGLPAGVTVSPIVIGAASSEATATLSAAPAAAMGIKPITLKAQGASDRSVRLAVAGPSGDLDTSFDNDGLILDSTNPGASVRAMTEIGEGGLLVAGTNGTGWLVRRYDEAGVPEATFNTNAAAVVPTTGMARAIALDPATGRIVVGGGSGASEAATIVRLNADGTADQTFGNAGTMRATIADHPTGSRVNAMVVTTGSTIVIAGSFFGPTRGIVERYTATGQRDAVGFAFYQDQAPSELTALLVLPSGALLATGTNDAVAPPEHLALRFLATGAPDTAFNLTGRASYPEESCRGASAALAANGDAVIVGQSVFGPNYCETRIAASAAGARIYTRVHPAGASDQFHAAAPGPGNTVYAAGQGGGSQDRVGVVLRRKADGDLDPTFAPGSDTPGVLGLQDPSVPDVYAYDLFALAPSRDGRLFIGGARTKSMTGFVVFRVWQ
ncbi:MAG: hypothetical protein KF819_26450 [Labilithrix sp.]|nr:hypothetical protein [Labilithrix sp.]